MGNCVRLALNHIVNTLMILQCSTICSNTQNPMPSLLVSSSSSQTPPQAVWKPVVTILKRPSGPASPSSSPVPSSGETFQEREKKYKEARDRIFAESSLPSEQKASTSTTTSNILRNPRGPDGEANGRGFGSRRGLSSAKETSEAQARVFASLDVSSSANDFGMKS